MEIELTDKTGQRFTWKISKRTRFTHIVAGKNRRHVWGYSFTDHEGVERVVFGQWLNLVSDLQFIASNYGLSTTLFLWKNHKREQTYSEYLIHIEHDCGEDTCVCVD
jgi:hypothetical protein